MRLRPCIRQVRRCPVSPVNFVGWGGLYPPFRPLILRPLFGVYNMAIKIDQLADNGTFRGLAFITAIILIMLAWRRGVFNLMA